MQQHGSKNILLAAPTLFPATLGQKVKIQLFQNMVLLHIKGVVLLRWEISLKVIFEKFKFAICGFCNNFSDYEWTYIYILFKTYLMLCHRSGEGGSGGARVKPLVSVWR